MVVALRLLALVGAGVGVCLSLVRGALTVDLGVGRRKRPLGPLTARIAAPPETVFDVIVAPYLGRTPRAMRDKLEVLERGSDMVLAAHSRPSAGSPPRPSRRSPSSAHIASRSGSSGAPCRTSSRAARSSAGTAPRCSSTAASSAATSGGSDSGGATASRPPGNARSRPHSTRSAPRRSAAADEPASRGADQRGDRAGGRCGLPDGHGRADETRFYWTPLVLGLSLLAAGVVARRTCGPWAPATVLVGWGAAVIFVRLAEPDLDTSGLYLAGAAAGALAGLALARHSFAVDPVTVAATAMLAGAVLALTRQARSASAARRRSRFRAASAI